VKEKGPHVREGKVNTSTKGSVLPIRLRKQPQENQSAARGSKKKKRKKKDPFHVEKKEKLSFFLERNGTSRRG